jgi:hypothetical protein
MTTKTLDKNITHTVSQTSQTELLAVARNLAFNGPTRPDALDYWSQQL